MQPHTTRILLWTGVVIGVFVLVIGLAKLGARGGVQGIGANGGAFIGGRLTKEVEATEHIKGNPEAKVALVEYSDFQCPACANAYQTVREISKEFENDVRVVYRHFPLQSIHANAERAAEASEAAALQEKFWEYHDGLFESQNTWSKMKNPDEFFVELATSLGLNAEQFKKDIDTLSVKERVQKDAASAEASGATGTPTFYLNGERISNPGSVGAFREVIQRTLDTKNNL